MAKTETALATLSDKALEAAQRLDISVNEERAQIERYKDHPAMRMFALAHAIKTLRDMMTVELIKEYILPLQGSPLGFLTDKDKSGGYTAEALREPMIEAMLAGLSPTGQEMCVIAGKCYAAKNGVMRKVLEYPGVTDFRISAGVPVMNPKGALVGMSATWKRNGTTESLHCRYQKNPDGTEVDDRIAVKTDGYTGTDAIIGKATRKLCKRVLDILGGATIAISDGDPDEFAKQPATAIVDVEAEVSPSVEAPRPHGQEGDPNQLFVKDEKHG